MGCIGIGIGKYTLYINITTQLCFSNKKTGIWKCTLSCNITTRLIVCIDIEVYWVSFLSLYYNQNSVGLKPWYRQVRYVLSITVKRLRWIPSVGKYTLYIDITIKRSVWFLFWPSNLMFAGILYIDRGDTRHYTAHRNATSQISNMISKNGWRFITSDCYRRHCELLKSLFNP